MRFQEVYEGWRERRLSQSEAAEILGVCERSFRRYSARYEDSEGDLNSLADKRLSQTSKRKAASTEIDALIALYQSRFIGWNVLRTTLVWTSGPTLAQVEFGDVTRTGLGSTNLVQ